MIITGSRRDMIEHDLEKLKLKVQAQWRKQEKLSPEQVRKMRRAYEAGTLIYLLAREYSVSSTTARRVVLKLTYQHVRD